MEKKSVKKEAKVEKVENVEKIDKKTLTAELHKMGIKTYRKKSTDESFVKRGDVKKVLAAIEKKSKK